MEAWGDNVYTRTYFGIINFFTNFSSNSVTFISETSVFLWNLGLQWWWSFVLVYFFASVVGFVSWWFIYSFVLILLGYLESEGYIVSTILRLTIEWIVLFIVDFEQAMIRLYNWIVKTITELTLAFLRWLWITLNDIFDNGFFDGYDDFEYEDVKEPEVV